MQINIREIANQLVLEGYSSDKFDTDQVINRVVEILAETEFFPAIGEAMETIENEEN